MARKLLGGVLVIAVLAYGGSLLSLFMVQRKMMYFPSHVVRSAAQSGLAHASTLALETPDGETIAAWYQPPTRDDRSIFLFLHGNNGELSGSAPWLKALSADGSGFLAIDYRGYGGSTGSPTEAGLILDGDTAYATLRSRGYGAARIVIVGESLGGGVAVAVASKHEVRALILDSAFSSAVDVAASDYPFFPIRMLMEDPFPSSARIAAVEAPKLFLYGGRDSIIPRFSAMKLFAAAREPKTLLEYPELGHVISLTPVVFEQIEAWLAALPRG